MHNASLSMLLYLVSALVQLLFANSIGHSAVLSGASSHGNCKQSLTSRKPVPSPVFHCRI